MGVLLAEAKEEGVVISTREGTIADGDGGDGAGSGSESRNRTLVRRAEFEPERVRDLVAEIRIGAAK